MATAAPRSALNENIEVLSNAGYVLFNLLAYDLYLLEPLQHEGGPHCVELSWQHSFRIYIVLFEYLL